MIDIKRCIEEFKPEGFEFVEGGNNVCRIRTPELGLIINTCAMWTLIYYPLFLQRICDRLKIVAFNDNDREAMIKEFLDTNELWRAIQGYNGIYEVSNIGNVRRLNNIPTSGTIGDKKLLEQTLDKQGYYRVSLSKNGSRKNALVSRLVAQAFIADYHEYMFTDHIDRNPKNNTMSNLRMVTVSQSSANTGKKKNRSSIYKGVHWNKRDKKWIAQATKDKKLYSCGRYNNEKEAGLAYDEKIVELFGEYATTNKGLGLL